MVEEGEGKMEGEGCQRISDTLGKYAPALSNRSVRKGVEVVETCGKFETPS